MKLLIIEDEDLLATSVAEFLKREGYHCETASTSEAASEKIAMYQYECILLDINLPDGSGLDLIPEIKQRNPDAGLVIISARNSLEDKISGLDLGADDYLTKPFHLAELNSRIKSIIRRRNFDGTNEITYGNLTLNFDKRIVSVHSEPIDLTKKEYDLLVFLMINHGRVIARETIAEHLWGEDADLADSFDFIYSHIKNLRRKMMDAGGEDLIKTVYGIGYKFEEA